MQQYAPAPSALDALPDLPAEFTGRDEDLAPLLDLLAPDSSAGRPVAVVAGMGGVGKTTLAHAIGHGVLKRAWFTGVLLVDLRGYDPQPVQPEQSLDALLRRLGVPAEHIPPTAPDREVFYRSHLADRARKGERLLVIADNASSAAQVKPLLPPAPHGMIATSRKALPGIGRPRSLHQLQPEDAVALLDLALREANPDDQRVEQDQEAAERVAVACGCLPLALHIVAALLVQDPGQPLAERAEYLTAGGGRLDSINDGERDLRTVFDQTLDSLLPQQQDLFRTLSLNAGPDISTPAAAALTHQTETAIENQLSQLAAAHLIIRSAIRGRWHMHDLLRDYAEENKQRHLENNRTARRKYGQARQRLADHYVKWVESARTHIDFSKQLHPSPGFGDWEEALQWMDKERANLIATAHFEAPSEASARICFALTEYLQYRELHHDALAVSALSLDSLRALKDRRNEPGAWSNLGYALWQLHRYDEALDAHTTARTLHEQSGDTRGQAVAWDNIGNALRRLHRYDEALDAHTTARTLHEQTGDILGQAVTWDNVGNVLEALHRYDEALDAHTTARTLHEQTGDTHGQAVTWSNVGNALEALHRYDEALDAHTTARTLHEQTGNTRGQAAAWNNTGDALRQLHRYDEALDAHTTARTLHEQTGNTRGQAVTWDNVGIVLEALHRYDEAFDAHTTARTLYEQTGNTRGQAVTWDNVGNALEALHRYDEALDAHTTARTLHEQTGNTNGQAVAWNNTGDALRQLHRYDEALDAHTTARTLYEQTGDTNGQAVAWNNTGDALRQLHRYDEAFDAHTTARTLYEQTGDTNGQAVAWSNVGNVLEALNRYDEAFDAHTTARTLHEQTGDTNGQAVAWNNTGDALRQLHRYDEAFDAHTTARTLHEQTGSTRGQAVTWSNVGNVLEALHRYDEAFDAHTTARTLYEQTGDTNGQAVTWSNVGNALEALNRYDEALDAHTTARTLHEQTGNTHGQAVAWNNIGTTFRGLHRYDEAVASGRRAVEMLESLGDLTRTGEALGELATSLDAANADPTVVRDAWLRSAGAYDSAGATEKGDQSRANAA
ncbi:tetratricopeptide repeat protein [Streptomyces sp. NA02536]|uniref:tetratricopeptide repeat protein n=1 Tax=Streptomyces sp. NA02536 TaxID=2742133 RepID=UPI0015914772|nr:tetratricopeptide repeat protein [Streptomyces sp. NA02536]QKW01699.1 tetratricopeptide repeat protein [Streptomyces sp. NA02536]